MHGIGALWLVLGGVVVSTVSSFLGNGALARAGVVVGALLAAVAAIAQYRTNEVLTFDVQEAHWISCEDGFEYVISSNEARGRSDATVFIPLESGGREEVLADIHVLSGGGVRIGSGTREHLIIELRR